jgi:hypothetical protein
MDLQNNLVLNKNKMTAIIAVLDEQWVHIWTDGRSCCNWSKTDDFVKCKILDNRIIYAWSWDADIIDIVERFYKTKWLYDIEDETLFELKEYIDKYNDNEYWIIFSDWNIIKVIEKKYLKYEDKYIRGGTWWLQALSAYNALRDNVSKMKHNQWWLIEQAIQTAIDMDENCWWTPKYYFLKKPDGK